MNGFVVLNKPTGITSRSAINRIKHLVRPDKVGHAGTLDPLARGVLVAAIGNATRLVVYVQRMPKQYRGDFLLGRASETDDIDGSVTVVSLAHPPTVHEIEQVLPAFCGWVSQRPPAYSAIKVAGRRAYDLARRGHSIQLDPRPVQVYSIKLVEYEYPRLTLDICCGSGTYVRALGRDIAMELGTTAVLEGLVRTRIGDFSIADSIAPDAIDLETLAEKLAAPAMAVSGLPRWTVTTDQLRCINLGQTIDAVEPADEAEVAAFDEAGALRAILVPRTKERWRPRAVFRG